MDTIRGDMQTFRGEMVPHDGRDPYHASVLLDGQWVRVIAGKRRVGAWATESVQCERVTVFRFRMTLDGVIHTFSPEEPGEFATAIGSVIDLRSTSRFGLGERVKAAKEELARHRAAAEVSDS